MGWCLLRFHRNIIFILQFCQFFFLDLPSGRSIYSQIFSAHVPSLDYIGFSRYKICDSLRSLFHRSQDVPRQPVLGGKGDHTATQTPTRLTISTFSVLVGQENAVVEWMKKGSKHMSWILAFQRGSVNHFCPWYIINLLIKWFTDTFEPSFYLVPTHDLYQFYFRCFPKKIRR